MEMVHILVVWLVVLFCYRGVYLCSIHKYLGTISILACGACTGVYLSSGEKGGIRQRQRVEIDVTLRIGALEPD